MKKPFELEYEPRKPFIHFHQRTQRWSCIVAHRRAGKTVACVNELVVRATYSTKKNPRYGYVAPFRQQAKNIAWVYLKEAVRGFAIEIRESDLSVKLPNGAIIALYGSDNPDALRGLYFDGLVVDEFGDCRPSLWAEVLLPTLADRKGWCVFIGTPKGRNQFYQFYELSKKSPEWFSLTLDAESSKLLDDGELAQLKEQMSEAQYEQEMLCSFTAALLGTYYATLINKLEANGQVNNEVQYDPNFPVIVSADIGYSDSTVLWFFQERPDGLAIIDCEEGHGNALTYYFDLLDQKPYTYDTIWLPHDARAKSLQTGKSTIEQFIAHFKGTGTKLDITPSLKVQHGIDAVRMVLPYCHFNHERCDTGIEALRTYRRKFDEINKVYMDNPLHSWESDYADSFRYLALVANKKKLQPLDPHESATKDPYNGYNLADLFAEREKPRGSRIRNMRI
jgi:phage terminase large subunit